MTINEFLKPFETLPPKVILCIGITKLELKESIILDWDKYNVINVTFEDYYETMIIRLEGI